MENNKQVTAEEKVTEAIEHLKQSKEWKKRPERSEAHICWFVSPERIGSLMSDFATLKNQQLTAENERLRATFIEVLQLYVELDDDETDPEELKSYWMKQAGIKPTPPKEKDQ